MENTDKHILITGGAGFIGSNIVDSLVLKGYKHISVLDNLETGSLSNIEAHIQTKAIRFTEGDIADEHTCLRATEGVDVVLHQAALGSVPRSIKMPLATHKTNVTGFLNMLDASRQNKVKRFVYASSSSVYGNDMTMPKQEDTVGDPLSPYAVSKKTNELYAHVFSGVYGMETIGLRYFNVFGPKQNPQGPYAAVIPIFMNMLLAGQSPVIYGDGTNTRDFTYVGNVVEANLLAAFTQNAEALNTVYNVAYGSTTSLNHLFAIISKELGSHIQPAYAEPRIGEIRDSLASIDRARSLLGYRPSIDLDKGIKEALKWYQNNQAAKRA